MSVCLSISVNGVATFRGSISLAFPIAHYRRTALNSFEDQFVKFAPMHLHTMMPRYKIVDLDLDWIRSIEVSDEEIKSKVACAKFSDKAAISENTTADLLVKGINCVDLSLLFGNETPDTVEKLCEQAAHPLATCGLDKSKMSKVVGDANIHCAAVCVYPLRIEDANKGLTSLEVQDKIKIASVAAGFPTGQFPLHTRLAEIYYAVAKGAQEVDVVIDRSLVLRQLWSQLYSELVEMRKACGNAVLKVILSVTECGSLANVYKASAVAMSAGADFIKTSTGKEATTMTINEGLVMCLAIKDFHARTGFKVGIKPAGGVRTAEQVISWMMMLREVLGQDWVDPSLFRIGTSGTSSLIQNVAEALTKC